MKASNFAYLTVRLACLSATRTFQGQLLRHAMHYLCQPGLGNCEVKALAEKPSVIAHKHVQLAAFLDRATMLGVKHNFAQHAQRDNPVCHEA